MNAEPATIPLFEKRKWLSGGSRKVASDVGKPNPVLPPNRMTRRLAAKYARRQK